MRARNIKPGFFKNEVLAEMPAISRLLFIGLWTLADREGRLEDRPLRIKGELFPYESTDVGSILGDLQSAGFLIRYEVDGQGFIQIQNFVKHQDPHYKEKASVIPPPHGCENLIKATGLSRARRAAILERDNYTCQICGSTTNLCVDHILPVSRGGDSSEENLQCLCMSCNTKKSNKVDGEERGLSRSKFNDTSVISRPVVGSTSGRVERVCPSDSLIPDSLIPDSNNPPTPLGGVVGSPVEAKPARKRTPKAERLGGFAPEVVELVRRLMGVWPTQRDGKPMRNDDVAAAANITRLLADHPDVTIAELEDAALGWLSTKPAFPNAIEFWFGRGKGGSMPPWEREVRGLRTRQVSA